MSQQTIVVAVNGTTAADTIKTGFTKANENFTEIYAGLQTNWEPYYWAVPNLNVGVFLASSQIGGADLSVSVILFHIPRALTVNRIICQVVSVGGSGSREFGFGIYSLAGARLTAGVFGPTVLAGGGVCTVPSYTITPGSYYFAYMQNCTSTATASVRAIDLTLNSVGVNLSAATVVPLMATAANPATTGPTTMPAALGTLSPNTSGAYMPQTLLLGTAA